MNDEFFTIRAKLLDYELNGITKQEKIVFANAIEQLLKVAVTKRDALAVVKIQRLLLRLNVLTPKEASTEQDQIPTKVRTKLLTIAIFVVGIILTIVTNVASGILPHAIASYLWLSWPLLIVSGLISIYLIWRQ